MTLVNVVIEMGAGAAARGERRIVRFTARSYWRTVRPIAMVGLRFI
jgi:hypothetical protein